MYLDHFGLARQPFQITPDADFFYPGADREDTLLGLTHSAVHHDGIVKVIGEIGSGKSLLCRMLADRLPDHFRVVFLANPHLSATEVVTAILADLGIEPKTGSYSHPTQVLQDYLLAQDRLGNRVILLVEEAQAMPRATLEGLRLLSNLETAESKLLRMILFGQPELDQTLGTYELRQFRDRITQNFYLRPMSERETGEYLQHRLEIAGYRGPALFTPELLPRLQQISGGRLRPLNIIADKMLLAAFVQDQRALTEEHLGLAQQEVATPTLVPESKVAKLTAGDGSGIATDEISWQKITRFAWRQFSDMASNLLNILQKWLNIITLTGVKKFKLLSNHPLTKQMWRSTKRQTNLILQKIRSN